LTFIDTETIFIITGKAIMRCQNLEITIMMTEIEETRQRIRELEDDLTVEYGAFGELEWGETETSYNKVRDAVYQCSIVWHVLPDGYEGCSGYGSEKGDGELEGLSAELSAIEELEECLMELKISVFNTCEEVEGEKRLDSSGTN
jgi:hypothetical protein